MGYVSFSAYLDNADLADNGHDDVVVLGSHCFCIGSLTKISSLRGLRAQENIMLRSEMVHLQEDYPSFDASALHRMDLLRPPVLQRANQHTGHA